MTIEISDSQDQVSQAEYDAEWGEEALEPVIATDDDQTFEEGSAPSDEAQSDSPKAPIVKPVSKAAEPESEDIYAGLTEKQAEAIRQAERNEKANLGRFRIAKDKADRLERELTEERQLRKDFEDKARQPSQFEQDHPEYYKELRESIKAELGTNSVVVPEVDKGQVAVDAILGAHPDAGDIYNSPDFQSWIGGQPRYVRNTIESSDPEDVISVLDSYKSSKPVTAPRVTPSSQDKLAQVAHVGGSPARPDLSRPSDMTTSQQYDAEWAKDD